MGVFKKLLVDSTEEEVLEIIENARKIVKNQEKKVSVTTKMSCVKSLESSILRGERGAK